MDTIKDITSVILYIAVIGLVGCLAAAGLAGCAGGQISTGSAEVTTVRESLRGLS